MNKRAFYGKSIVAVLLVAICVVSRVLPHPPNFAPVVSATLFAGLFFRSTWLGLLLGFTAMTLSDLLIGGYEPEVMAAVYLTLLLPAMCGSRLSKELTLPRLGLAIGLSSIVTAVIVDFATWKFGFLYENEQTLTGLLHCYAAGLPFLKYRLAGDCFWSVLLIGVYALAGGMLGSPIASARQWLGPVSTKAGS